MDGEKFEGGSTDGQGTDLVLGSGSYIDGFEDGVVGHKVGENFDLNLKFPDDYKVNTELAGKDVTFEVTLNGVYK
jgi:FKBP-type peptidyl-prolyl cis-trans isomerase (trigger factor)